MPLRCCVPQCKSIFKKGGISFHSIPKDEIKRKRFLSALGLEHLSGNWQRVCAKHFDKNDFVFGGNLRKISKLTVPKRPNHLKVLPKNVPEVCETVVKEIVPKKQVSLYWENEENSNTPPKEVNIAATINASKESPHPKVLNKRKIVTNTITPLTPLNMSWNSEESGSENNGAYVVPNTSVAMDSHEINEEGNSTACQCASYLKIIEALEVEVTSLKKENQRLKEASSPKPPFCLQKFAGNDKKILFYTGFQKFQILLLVLKWILPSGNINDITFHNTSKGKGLKKHLSKLSVQDQFFLTLLRLKRGMCIETLADLFSVSKSTVDNIFLSWINLMYLRLGCLDIWPNRNVLINRGSESLKEKYSNVIGSIECIEFFIERPSSLHKQSQCYSYYKGATTLKSLIMIDPAGAIIYVSPLFTGSISDKAIIKSSGFLKILQDKVGKGQILPGDVILADKGFNVTDLFQSNNLEINIPVFKMSGMQSTAEEVVKTRKIAQERIHIERAIHRLKCFRILSSRKIPISCLGNFQQIYVVCALLCNFKSSLIK